MNSDFEDTEEQTLSESNLTETSPPNANTSSDKIDIPKSKNQSKRRKKYNNQEAGSKALVEEVSEIQNSKLKQEDANNEGNSEVEPKPKKEAKKRPSKKRTQNQIVENTDSDYKEDYEENSKQKRKGWWSLKG